MTIEIIILAQGTQQRLRPYAGFKQLLPLPACGGVPLLCRTVRLVWVRCGIWPTITAVTWPDVRGRSDIRFPHNGQNIVVAPAYVPLADPGNSSLKGIARYLETRGGRRYEQTVVLLGDVVYSWACLDALWQIADGHGFVGTKDLASDRGEVWGVAWHRRHEDDMMSALRDALLRHPPFDDNYQPGQMRRWITGWARGDLRDHVAKHRALGRYADIDDYTHDIDVPHDLALLPELSAAAASDDEAHGMSWTDVSWGPGLAQGGAPMTGE